MISLQRICRQTTARGKDYFIGIIAQPTNIKTIPPSRSISITGLRRTESRPSYIHNIGEDPLQFKTIGGCLEEAADRWPDRPFVTSCQESLSLSFSQVLEEADRLAAGFLEIGLEKGDRIGICSHNSTRWVVGMMAAARAGLIMVAINPAYQRAELEYCVNKVGIKCLMVPSAHGKQNYYEMLVAMAPGMKNARRGDAVNSQLVPDLRSIIIMDNIKIPGTYRYHDVYTLGKAASSKNISGLQSSIRPDDACNIQFTSGTTGKPKAAYFSHFNYINNGYFLGKRNLLSDTHQKICTQVPLFHAFGLVIVTMAALRHGSTLVMPSFSYSPESGIKAIAQEGCTVLTGTPTMYVDMVSAAKSTTLSAKPVIAVTGGAPCSPKLFHQIKETFGVETIKSVFGMTETTAVCFQSMRDESMEKITESVGRIQEHLEAKVIDTNGHVVPFGTPGELCIRGYTTMLGYWNDPKNTSEIIGPDKWLKTGDQFVLHEDGYGKVVGRLKDVIIRGGENIYPKEVEDFLNSHPDVVESHVFGVKDERLGEEVCVGVRTREGAQFNLSSLQKFCEGQIARYKVPRITTAKREFLSPSYAHRIGERPLQHETIGQCLERAANAWPDRPWLISRHEKSMTYSQVLEEADRLAAGLLESGLQPGDRIGICSPNSLRWVITAMAAARAGLITVAINPAYQAKELEYCVKRVHVRALAVPSSFKNQNYYGMLRVIAPELGSCNPGDLVSQRLPSVKTIFMLDDKKMEGVSTYNEILSRSNSQTAQQIASNQHLISPESGFVILYTSGTTGQPKAALLSHYGYVNNSWEGGLRNELSEKNHTLCLQIPLFHAFGLLTSMGVMQHGATMVFPSPLYNVDKAMEAIIHEKCTALTGTPTMYVDLVTKQRRSNAPVTSAEVAITGGAPCSAQLFNQIRDHLGVHTFKSVYGMTESSVVFQSLCGEDIFKATETVGSILGHAEVKIVNSDGDIVPMGTPGELMVRSYSNMVGYWGDPEKTMHVLNKDKWLHTGDQFILEDGGYGRISGRLKDLIIRGGENIFPKEIEDFLNTHPDVIETQVFGVKDERLGEEICASVRVKEGSDFGYNQMKNFCKGAIAHFKVPKLLKIVDQFPVTASGKIQKFKLREMVESGRI